MIRADTVDADGRILAQRTLCPTLVIGGPNSPGNPCLTVTSKDHRVSSRYNRLGMLGARTDADVLETYEYDASGNLTARRTDGANHRYVIAAGSNRVVRDTFNTSSPDSILYDDNGARWITQHSSTAIVAGYYYDGLERPTAVLDAAHHTDPADCMQYDGASRLVQPCYNEPALRGFDGPNIAAAGNFRFVHGPGVDDPLVGLYRPTTGSPVEYFWVTDGQGRQLAVGLVDGTMSGSSPGDYATQGGSYAGGTANAQSFAASRFETPVAPGFSFFRNRIYDQGTGRWTQEDPIGLAGGSNLYQYAGNNPATYTDPFGLCEQVGNCVQGDGGVEQALDYIEEHSILTPGHAARVLADPRSSTLERIGANIEAGFSLPGTGGMGAASEAGQGVRLFRFGTESESVEKLATSAANAERNRLPHGVSVTTRVPTQTPASSAAREAVEQHFPVVRTGSKPGHHTVVLPKPITQEIADLFNRLFGRP